MTTLKKHSGRTLPASLGRLEDLAFNLWWTWNPDAEALFSRIDSTAWEALRKNPVALLQSVKRPRWRELAADPDFKSALEAVARTFDAYMNASTETWFRRHYPNDSDIIAYFCMEYAIHESIPVYSGGLGVLAGDHCKTASDLGLPFVAVGLWYPNGYFRQQLAPDGAQLALPEGLQTALEPLLPAGRDGGDVTISVRLLDRDVLVRVWKVQVGRVPLYLLDTDVPGNAPGDRELCHSLYGGDRETRIQQEIVLGVGGVRALRALHIDPTVWHMNEGHAGFLALERIREYVQQGKSFEEAWPLVTATTVFTTHTPVPAGNEVFTTSLIEQYFSEFPAQMGIDTAGFLALASEAGAPPGNFAMTPFALRMSHRANGVSALHGEVARRMWARQYPDLTLSDVPISAITNGVHTPTWIAPEFRTLFSQFLGRDWLDRVDDPEMWQAVASIPDESIWSTHLALKARLLAFAERRVTAATGRQLTLNPDALTLGFARRFATYKRATLFFHDLDRAIRLLGDTDRPIQLLFAGKAHPADGGGQHLIRAIHELSSRSELAGRVVFLEGYDMNVARYLVHGVDLWLNNPERPQEASGTSGQKAALNGVPNCSVRDGWWDEAFNGKNGWAFGGEVGDEDIDSAQLYAVLEEEVLPTFFSRTGGSVPKQWVAVMREAIRTCAPTFSTQRMVKEYVARLYR